MKIHEFFQQIEENLNFLKSEKDNNILSKFVKQFYKLISLISNDGKFIDPFLKSNLDFQYHYSFIVLLGLIMYKLNETTDFIPKIYKVFDYWSKIPEKVTLPSLEFNNFAICLIYLFQQYISIEFANYDMFLQILKNKVEKMEHNSYADLISLNNNFKFLTGMNLYLHGKILNNEKKVQESISLMKQMVLKCQMDDGFFPDTNMKKEHKIEKNKGVVHLVYHSKISMLVLFLGILTNDSTMKNAAKRAMDNIICISSFEGESCYYGRSQNSLFGYSCLFLGINLLYVYVSRDKKYIDFGQKILRLVLKYQFKDGYFSTNLNRKVNSRPGYDGYMYSIVYNTYSNLLFLLGIIINPEILLIKSKIYDKDEFLYFINSGFLKIKEKKLEFCLNTKGNVNCYKYYLDSRLAPLTLQYFNFSKIDLIPSVPMKAIGVPEKVNRSKIYDKLKIVLNNLGYNLAIGGYQPYFLSKSTPFIIRQIFHKIINFNNYFLNFLESVEINDKSINLLYSLKASTYGLQFLKKILNIITHRSKFKQNIDLKESYKVQVQMKWNDNSIEYIINGPDNMFCIFPLRFYQNIELDRKSKKILIIYYSKIQIKFKSNLNFKLLKILKKFKSGKGFSKIIPLKFDQSKNINIKMEMFE